MVQRILVNDSLASTPIAKREVHLDANSNGILDQTYVGSTMKHEDAYTYLEGGCEIKIKKLLPEYRKYDQDKVVLETDGAGNVNPIKDLYKSHFETTTFKFDEAGNLISQKNTGTSGYVEEKSTLHCAEFNPLRNLIETPLPQAISHYDDLTFYFSTIEFDFFHDSFFFPIRK